MNAGNHRAGGAGIAMATLIALLHQIEEIVSDSDTVVSPGEEEG